MIMGKHAVLNISLTYYATFRSSLWFLVKIYIYKLFIGEKWPYCGRIVAIGDFRIEAVSWPYRGSIVTVSWAYRGRIEAFYRPYRGRKEAVLWPYIEAIPNVPFAVYIYIYL